VHKDGPKYDHTKVFKIKGKLANALADSTGKQEYKNPNRGNDARKVVRELLVALQTEAARIHWSIFDEAVRTTTRHNDFHKGKAFRAAALNSFVFGCDCRPKTIIIDSEMYDSTVDLKVQTNFSLRKTNRFATSFPNDSILSRYKYAVVPLQGMGSQAKSGDTTYTVKSIRLSMSLGGGTGLHDGDHTFVFCRDTSVPLDANADWSGDAMPQGKRAAWYEIPCLGSSPVKPISIREVKKQCQTARFSASLTYERVGALG